MDFYRAGLLSADSVRNKLKSFWVVMDGMGYCGRCGKPVDDVIVGYNTQTGEPIYGSSHRCDDCKEKLSNALANLKQSWYEKDMEKLKEKSEANLIDSKTWLEESYRIRKKYLDK